MTRSTKLLDAAAIDAAFGTRVPPPVMPEAIAPLAAFELAMSMVGLGLDIYALVKGESTDPTAEMLSIIDAKLNELVTVSGQILAAVDDNRVLLTATYVSDIRSDISQALHYLVQYGATGDRATAQLAIEKSVEAMSDITTFSANAPVEQGLLASTMVAAVAVRELVIRQLQDGAFSGEFRGELEAAQAVIARAVPLLGQEVIEEMQFEWAAVPDPVNGDTTFLVALKNQVGREFAFSFVQARDQPGLYGVTSFAEFLVRMREIGFGWVIDRNVQPMIDQDRLLLGIPKVQAAVDDLAFDTSGRWLRGHDGTVDDVLTSSQKPRYTSPDTLDGYRGDDTLTGGAGNDTLRGWEGNDTLAGNRGDDILRGADGRDLLSGGAGHNVLDGGTGIDTVSYAWATKGVRVSLDLSADQRTGVSTDQLSGVENLIGSRFADRLSGSVGANAIVGGAGNDRLDGFLGDDRLDGGAGDDTLAGGLGRDVLTGGAGRDRFVFDTHPAKDNVDTVADFDVRQDALVLDRSVFRAFADLKSGDTIGRDSFKDIGSGRADANDHVLYDSRTGDLFYDADGSGKGAAVLIAHLDPHLNLVAADFVVI